MNNKKNATTTKADKKKKTGRGGARANAGRKKAFATRLTSFDLHETLAGALDDAGISNKTAYINFLVAADLKKHYPERRKEFEEIERVMKKKLSEA